MVFVLLRYFSQKQPEKRIARRILISLFQICHFRFAKKSFCAEKDQSLDDSTIQLLAIKNEINSLSLYTCQIKIRFLFDFISI